MEPSCRLYDVVIPYLPSRQSGIWLEDRGTRVRHVNAAAFECTKMHQFKSENPARGDQPQIRRFSQSYRTVVRTALAFIASA